MTKDQQKIIRAAVEANREVIKRLQLTNQALMAQLPEPANRRRVADNGFFDLPVPHPIGNRLIYNDKLYRKYKAEKNNVNILPGGRITAPEEITV